MGIYDRDYYRQPTRRWGFSSFSMWSVTTWLIIINIAVFLIDSYLQQQRATQILRETYGPAYRYLPPSAHQDFSRGVSGPIEEWGYFSMTAAIGQLQLWRFISFQFLHANLNHIFSNMLSLYIFGPIVERYFGSWKYLAFYLLCGMAGAASYLLLLLVHVLQGADAPLIGASAGIFGVLVAGAVLAPNATILLIIPPIPLKLKYLALILVGWATYVALNNLSNAGGQAAHLGGAALGYLLIRFPRILSPFPRRRPPGMRAQVTDWTKDPNH